MKSGAVTLPGGRSTPERCEANPALGPAGRDGGLGGGLGGVAGVGGYERRCERPGVATFVFVAGAGGGTGGPNELALYGHGVVGVELPGHGAASGQFRRAYQAPQDLAKLATAPSPMAGVTLDDYVTATIDVVRRVYRHGPVILVGGSMGGLTLDLVGNESPTCSTGSSTTRRSAAWSCREPPTIS